MVRDLRPAIESGHVWIAGQPIRGLLCLSPVGQALLIENVAVHPSGQGTGLGRQLMDFAEEEARRGGFDHLRLYTNEVMTENVAFYEHLGYQEVDRRSEQGYRRVFMEKRLGES
jgi:ribosomal protein S18 acetylase RimI-like enzyme